MTVVLEARHDGWQLWNIHHGQELPSVRALAIPRHVTRPDPG
jgi:hypothetical protein